MSYDELYLAVADCKDALNWFALGEAIRLHQQVSVVCSAYSAAPTNVDAQSQLKTTAEAVSHFLRNHKYPDRKPIAHLSNLLIRMQTEART